MGNAYVHYMIIHMVQERYLICLAFCLYYLDWCQYWLGISCYPLIIGDIELECQFHWKVPSFNVFGNVVTRVAKQGFVFGGNLKIIFICNLVITNFHMQFFDNFFIFHMMQFTNIICHMALCLVVCTKILIFFMMQLVILNIS